MSDNMRNILEWIYCIVIALVVALLFRYFIGTPTIVKQRSMYPTLQENERLILNRTARIHHKKPKTGDIITFEAPTKAYSEMDANQNSPVAIYENEPKGVFRKFCYYVLEFTKKSYIKRVVATEGQHVEIKNNHVYINGVELAEEYLPKDMVTVSNVFNDFIVPEGYVFAMGDNRTKSTDCRELGCIPLNKVESIVVFRFWPFSNFGKVN